MFSPKWVGILLEGKTELWNGRHWGDLCGIKADTCLIIVLNYFLWWMCTRNKSWSFVAQQIGVVVLGTCLVHKS